MTLQNRVGEKGGETGVRNLFCPSKQVCDGAKRVEAKYLRQASVTYPGPGTRRAIYYNYPTSGIGGALVRLDNIASDNTEPAEADKFAAYGYLGAGTVVKVAYPAVTVSGNCRRAG
jgi:hypothetical protein